MQTHTLPQYGRDILLYYILEIEIHYLTVKNKKINNLTRKFLVGNLYI